MYFEENQQPHQDYQYEQYPYQQENNELNQPFDSDLKPGAVLSFFDRNNEFFQQRIVLTIILGLAILLSFYKNTLIDMIVFVIFLNFSLKNKMDEKINITAMTIALAVILILEFIWILGLSSNWWNNEDKQTDFEIEAGIKKFTVVFSYFQLISKFIAFILFGKLLLKSQEQVQKNNQEQVYV